MAEASEADASSGVSCICHFSEKLGFEVCLKTFKFPNFSAASQSISEITRQLNFQHKNVCKILDFAIKKDGESTYFLEVSSELLRPCNELIRERQATAPWSESKLQEYLCSLVEVLAEGQRRALTLRNLTLHSLFFDCEETIKLTDFGCSKWLHGSGDATHTIRSTTHLHFLSPKVREALSSGEQTATHNTYKSDVYSLGICLLCLALLRCDPPQGREQLNSELERVPHAELRRVLRLMTSEDEESRPDFLELEIILTQKSAPPTRCRQCHNLTVVENDAWRQSLPASYQVYSYFRSVVCSKACLDAKINAYWSGSVDCLMGNGHTFFANRSWTTAADLISSPYYDAIDRICSLSCWSNLLAGISRGVIVLCQNCKNRMRVSDLSVNLDCGHSFCSTGCFTEYLSRVSYGYVKQVPVLCPADGEEIAEYKVSGLLKEKCPNETFGVFSYFCVFCMCRDALIRLQCERHFLCKTCTPVQFCPFCRRNGPA